MNYFKTVNQIKRQKIYVDGLTPLARLYGVKGKKDEAETIHLIQVGMLKQDIKHGNIARRLMVQLKIRVSLDPKHPYYGEQDREIKKYLRQIGIPFARNSKLRLRNEGVKTIEGWGVPFEANLETRVHLMNFKSCTFSPLETSSIFPKLPSGAKYLGGELKVVRS